MILFLFFIIFTCEEILILMIVAHKEAALILKVEVSGETICIKFGDNLLFDSLKIDIYARI